MLDIKFIRENPEKIKQSAKDKGVDLDVDKLLKVEEQYRNLNIEIQKLREERNKAAKERDIEKGKEIKEKLEKQEGEFKNLESELQNLLGKIPNPAKPDVKTGKDESENEVIKTFGTPKKFSFTPKDHLALGGGR